jgi:hypothetical protein
MLSGRLSRLGRGRGTPLGGRAGVVLALERNRGEAANLQPGEKQ